MNTLSKLCLPSEHSLNSPQINIIRTTCIMRWTNVVAAVCTVCVLRPASTRGQIQNDSPSRSTYYMFITSSLLYICLFMLFYRLSLACACYNHVQCLFVNKSYAIPIILPGAQTWPNFRYELWNQFNYNACYFWHGWAASSSMTQTAACVKARVYLALKCTT